MTLVGSCSQTIFRAWFEKFSHIVQAFGMKHSEADHYVFYCQTTPRKCVYLTV